MEEGDRRSCGEPVHQEAGFEKPAADGDGVFGVFQFYGFGRGNFDFMGIGSADKVEAERSADYLAHGWYGLTRIASFGCGGEDVIRFADVDLVMGVTPIDRD